MLWMLAAGLQNNKGQHEWKGAVTNDRDDGYAASRVWRLLNGCSVSVCEAAYVLSGWDLHRGAFGRSGQRSSSAPRPFVRFLSPLFHQRWMGSHWHTKRGMSLLFFYVLLHNRVEKHKWVITRKPKVFVAACSLDRFLFCLKTQRDKSECLHQITHDKSSTACNCVRTPPIDNDNQENGE